MRLSIGLCIVPVIVTTVAASAPTIDLGGTVKDGKGTALAGAVVMLASDESMKDTTGAGGEFTISNATAIRRNRISGEPAGKINSLRIAGNQLLFSVRSSASNGTITIYSGNGKRNAVIELGGMEPGSCRQILPALTSGIYIMHVSIDRFDALLQLVSTGDGNFMSGGVSGVKSGFVESARRTAAAAVDTLVIEKEGFKTARKVITAYDQKNIAIVLDSESTGPTLPPITDYSSIGPFETVEEKGGPNNIYTIFRPKTLGENGFIHAPIVFGPGIGQTVVPVHRTMLSNYASHGFVIVGTPVLNQGPGGAQNLKTMKDALDWIVAQNTASGSVFQGKLWADHCVSMGFSVGGTSAVQLGADQAVFTVVSIHGHTADTSLHGPMLQTTGTNDGVGMPLQQATYDASKVQTFLATLTNAGHTYIESNGGGEERKAITAWMRYWIYNDTGARNFFFGDDCVLCKSPWQNPKRKNWVE
ncbi:MAG: hypothetical protein JW863_14935 [Chitinispirillaceae bacterium]|nr:hypothetical protein [Chitinispirillaceae bacterium]